MFKVLSTDMGILSTIQYAVDYLEIPHIVVCGHYDCGAVKAASKNRNHGAPLENWLTSIRDVMRMHRGEVIRRKQTTMCILYCDSVVGVIFMKKKWGKIQLTDPKGLTPIKIYHFLFRLLMCY